MPLTPPNLDHLQVVTRQRLANDATDIGHMLDRIDSIHEYWRYRVKSGMVMLICLCFGLISALSSHRETSAQSSLLCNGLKPTITGSGVITGTSGDDVIIGSAGNDTIKGGGGNDIICGAGGSDLIDGGTGNDRLAGESFDGELELGQPGADTIYGSSGHDTIVGVDGNDPLLDGGSGNDIINGNGDLRGGSGNDHLTVFDFSKPPRPTAVNGGSGRDTCDDPLTVAPTFTSCETVD